MGCKYYGKIFHVTGRVMSATFTPLHTVLRNFLPAVLKLLKRI
jgi:hypothetical protein